MTRGKERQRDSREGHDDEEGAVDALVLHEVGDEADGLDGLAQTHLISQDPIQVVVVQRHQPLQALDLRCERDTNQSFYCLTWSSGTHGFGQVLSLLFLTSLLLVSIVKVNETLQRALCMGNHVTVTWVDCVPGNV